MYFMIDSTLRGARSAVRTTRAQRRAPRIKLGLVPRERRSSPVPEPPPSRRQLPPPPPSTREYDGLDHLERNELDDE
jgi:hypothetical protein